MFQWAAGTFLVIWITAVPVAADVRKQGAMPSATAHEITVTTVFDNYAIDARLAMRWGFAAVITTPHNTVLFDTGSDGATLLSNMAKLHIDSTRIRKIVISHIHDDHLGGLRDFLRGKANVQVFIPRSFPSHIRQMIENAGARHEDVSAPTDIAPGISTTGPLGQSLQEQALVVKTSEGLVVITGCAHPGIVSIVRRAQAMSPKADIALVMGGFHLLSASPGQIDEIIRAFREFGVRRVAPSHCTGDLARSRFREVYGSNYVDGGAGVILRFAVPQIPAP
jgi:7,8-dihydropterin-6-yl-methyl-4-(beta-D-ribofuranosyl)aminobenzene 5'-phosphate synthase